MPVYTYDPPDRFVAGAVGQPGERTFYLQASAAGRITSVTLEKFQVSLLAERLDELLDEVLRRSGGQAAVPATAPAELADDGPLDLPLMEEFRVGAIASRWPTTCPRVVRRCCASGLPRPRPAPSRGARCRSSPRAGQPARSAGCRWRPWAMSARGRTATG
jgi:uncharacterized repeat protein (TIGR03847 family)